MQVGLLIGNWNKNLSVIDKIQQAAASYLKRFGRPAELCFVHISQFDPGMKVPGLTIRSLNYFVFPDNFWLGVEEARAERFEREEL